MVRIEEAQKKAVGSSDNEGKRFTGKYGTRTVTGYISSYYPGDDTYYVYLDDGTVDDSYSAKFVTSIANETLYDILLSLDGYNVEDNIEDFPGNEDELNLITRLLGTSLSELKFINEDDIPNSLIKRIITNRKHNRPIRNSNKFYLSTLDGHRVIVGITSDGYFGPSVVNIYYA